MADLPEKPRFAWQWKPPVAWLLGPQLVAALRRIALSALTRGAFDVRDWMAGREIDLSDRAAGDAYWFDYLADTGDGQKATFSIASICYRDVWVKGKEASFAELPGGTRLPRGDFLFMGGDTAYHIADHPTLSTQLQAPFHWAWQELGRPEGERRPLFGLPGNHDYYDELDGFNRQFRRPFTGEGVKSPRGDLPPLALPEFRREQEATYVALKLPFDWWWWSLDLEQNRIDQRQQSFFRGRPMPRRLIVTTPEPGIVGGAVAGFGSAFWRSYRDLELPFPVDELPPGACRLDLSGDVHHYERYGGDGSYASIVSGAGGAFHHPTYTRAGDAEAKVQWPPEDESMRAVLPRLWNPLHIARGGYVAVVGAILGAILIRGSLVPSRSDLRLARTFGIVLAFLLAGLAIGLAVWEGKRIYRLSYDKLRGRVRWYHWFGVWGAIVAAIVLPSAAIVWLGDAPASDVLADVVFQLTLFGLVGGLLYLGWSGADDIRPHRRALLALVGLWHGLMQAATPFILVRAGVVTTLGFIAVTTAASVLAYAVAPRKRDHRWRVAPVALLWLGLGGLLVVVAIRSGPFALGYDWRTAGYWIYRGGAALIGVWSSCAWLGWYLAVALLLDGHNNEAGGAARLERYKQMIRFRLDQDGLTAYVLGFREPSTDPKALRLELVDEVRLRPQPGGDGGGAAGAGGERVADRGPAEPGDGER